MSTDPTGVKSYVLYDAAGRKVADIDANGSLVESVYNANDQGVRSIAYATALTGTALASLMDANGKPANVTLASVRPSTSTSDRSRWNLYDAAGRLVKSVDEDGFVTQNLYDGEGTSPT